MPAKKSPSKRKRPAKQETGGGCPGATCSEFAGIQALIQIREALGDPCGNLMQDELVDKVLNLIQGEKELREGVITYIKDHEDESVDELKYLLDYTQWWDWDFTPPNRETMALLNDSKLARFMEEQRRLISDGPLASSHIETFQSPLT